MTMATGDSTTIDAEALRRALPDYRASLHVSGLGGTVEIFRDQLGVPHIRAGSLADAFFAQGYAHAQDRLWQMDYDRRRAAGRWAEWAGPTWVDQDKLMRRLGLDRSAQADYAAFDAETRAVFDAYAAGVNAFIETTAQLPIEYRLVGARPASWQPWDGCAIYKVRHVLMGTFGTKLWRARQLQSVGESILLTLRKGAEMPGPVAVASGVEWAAVPDGSAVPALNDVISGQWDWAAGSNNWALTGARTASGQPLLAGDPHRPLEVPNVYYQNHLACPDFDVIGYSFAGVPGFPHFGHNAEVAWCITHAGADYHDLYIEEFAADDPIRYKFQDTWRPATKRTETIAVRGGESIMIDVVETHHGPIVVGDPRDGYALALRYSATAAPDAGFTSFLPMLRARTVAEFDDAMRPWVDPANNLLIADRQGAVGYLMRGQVPQRDRANGWFPVPGWTGEHEWGAPIPFEDLPRARDPQTGYFVTANNRIVTDDYPYFITLDWAPAHRAMRIESRLGALSGATVTDMAAVHAERLSLPSRVFTARLDQLAIDDSRVAAARDLLRVWDGTMAPELVAPTIYALWREHTTALLVERGPLAPLAAIPPTEDPVPLRALSLGSRLRSPIAALLAADDRSLLPTDTSWDDLLAESLSRAVAWLTERLGPEMNNWGWATLHRTAPKHTLAGAFPALADLLNPPAVGVGGDGDTPQAAAYAGLAGVGFTLTNTSVARYCFDLADWDSARPGIRAARTTPIRLRPGATCNSCRCATAGP
jgi:penicillin amidase